MKIIRLVLALSLSLPLAAMQTTAQREYSTLLSLLEAFIVGNGHIAADDNGSLAFAALSRPNCRYYSPIQYSVKMLTKIYQEKSKSLEDLVPCEQVSRCGRLFGILAQEAVKQMVENLTDEEKVLLELHRSPFLGPLFTDHTPLTNEMVKKDAENRIKVLQEIRQATQDRAKDGCEDAASIIKIERLYQSQMHIQQELLKKPEIITSRQALLHALQKGEQYAINEASLKVVPSPELLPPLEESLKVDAAALVCIYPN